MNTVTAFILTVIAFSGGQRGIQAPPPHSYYPTMTACQKAGQQWQRNLVNANTSSRGNEHQTIYHRFSCEEQTILVPKG